MRLPLALCLVLSTLARAQEALPPPPPPPPSNAPPLVEVPEPPAREVVIPVHEREGYANRLVLKGVGGLAGMLPAVAVYLLSLNGAGGGGLVAGLALATPIAVFFMPFTMWATAKILDMGSWYWWTVLGAIPGWVLSCITFAVTGEPSGRVNPVAFASWTLPVVSALALHEAKADYRRAPEVGLWLDKRGGRGLVVSGTF